MLLDKNAVYMPEKPVGNALVPQGTPFHVAEVFIALMRRYFAATPLDFPFHYDPEDYGKCKILFDTAYNKGAKAIGKKPLVIVTRGPQTTSPIMYRDLGQMNLPNIGNISSTLVGSSVLVRILSRKRSEVDLLSQHVFSYCLMNRTRLPQLLGIHMVNSLSLSEPARMDQDDETYLSQLNLDYVMQFTWARLEQLDEPVLAGVETHINNNEAGEKPCVLPQVQVDISRR